MNGSAHATIGATSGFIVANACHATPLTTLFLVGVGGISGLIPDLDIDGTLRGKITISHKIIRAVTQLLGLLMIFYSLYGGIDSEKWIGIGIGIGMMAISLIIKQKHMLTITGLGMLVGGLSQQESWLLLLGIYIIVASFVTHRSYTHSLLGILFYGVIGFNLEASLGINGVFYSCIVGYISHLIADLKFLPFNKRGIKLFLPFSSKEL